MPGKPFKDLVGFVGVVGKKQKGVIKERMGDGMPAPPISPRNFPDIPDRPYRAVGFTPP